MQRDGGLYQKSCHDKVGRGRLFNFGYAQYVDISKLFDINLLKRAFSKFAAIELDLKYSLNPENLFESACLELVDSAAVVPPKPAEQKIEPAQPPKPAPVQPAPVQPVEQEKEITEIERMWGNVLIKFKEYNMFALINALRSVNKVEEQAHKLILHTNDLSSFETIDNSERIDVILKTAKLFDDSLTAVEAVYDKDNASTQDIKDNLKQVFKSKIKFKE